VKPCIAATAERALSGQAISRTDAGLLVQWGLDDPWELMQWAHRVRRATFGDAVRMCGIIAGKAGGCTENCKWCAQGARLMPAKHTAPDEIIAAAVAAAKVGASCFGIVNSGRTPSEKELGSLVAAALAISGHPDCKNLPLCASVGELTDQQAARLVAAGFKRYNHNLETSATFYPQVVSSHAFDDRVRTLAAARSAGMGLCCGGIFGLGESWQDRIDLALTLRDQVSPDVVPLNFLHPIPGTPGQNNKPLPPMEILVIVAVFRLILPKVDLKIAGGREVNLRDLQSWMFYAGATSGIIGNYLTTAGRDPQADLQMIADLGLKMVREFPKADGIRD
jgi:biotin synthase